jgi:hypothetical protein
MGNNGINYNEILRHTYRFVNMVKQYYPDIFGDFNDASVGMMILEPKCCCWGYVISQY